MLTQQERCLMRNDTPQPLPVMHLHKINNNDIKGCTHRVTEALRWVSMSTSRCIERVCRSVGTLLYCGRWRSFKWLSMVKVFFKFRLNSNMSNIFFAIGMFSYQIWLNRTVGTLFFNGFR